MASSAVNRRRFIKSASAASAIAFSAATPSAKSYARIIGSNDRLGYGVIGAGGMGKGHLNSLKSLREKDNLLPVAVADCWNKRAQQGKSIIEAEHSYQDYRELLDRDDIDVVTIATPEHWHCKMTLDALESGKHVYCEKPMTHTLEESLAVVKVAQGSQLKVQVGVQAMSDDSYRSARKAIDDGLLGQVVQAQIEYVRRYNGGPWRIPGLNPKMEKPADMNWNAWLGNADPIDWNPNHYFEWRNYSSYSGGIATDLFIHRITRIMSACRLGFPSRVVGMGGIWQWDDGRDLPDNFEMICEYPRGMTVYVLGTMSNRVGIKHLIRGYRATLEFTNQGWQARDKDGKLLQSHTKTGGEDIHLHHTNHHNAIRVGEALNCPVELGLAGVAAVTMANASWKTGTMMAWDSENQKAVPANQLTTGVR